MSVVVRGDAPAVVRCDAPAVVVRCDATLYGGLSKDPNGAEGEWLPTTHHLVLLCIIIYILQY